MTGTEAATRTAVLLWPQWPVVAALAQLHDGEPGQAAAVLRANRIVALSPAAQIEGVTIGQRRRDAQRVCPHLVLLDHDPDRDARAFEPVVHALEQLVPLLEINEPGRCSFATIGPSRYFGGDQALGELVARTAAAAVPVEWSVVCGEPTVGIADGTYAAGVAARTSSGRSQVIAPGTSARFLAVFPVGELATAIPDGETFADLLIRLGVRRLGDLAAMSRADLIARFGMTGELSHRIACGLELRPPVARRPPPDLVVSVAFEEPVQTTAPVAFAAKRLGDELIVRLTALGLACTALVATAQTDHGEQHERQWRHDLAFSAISIAERVRWQLDGWAGSSHPPTAGISMLRLTPVEVVAAVGVQEGFWGGRSHADERASRGVARLIGLLGVDAVLVPEWRGGRHDPYVMVPAAISDPGDRAVGPGEGTWPGRLPTPTPATLSDLAVEVLDEAGQPVRVTSRGFVSATPAIVRYENGRSLKVVDWAGPWPIEERWWDTQRHRRVARCQFLLETGGAHLVVVENTKWRVTASYD